MTNEDRDLFMSGAKPVQLQLEDGTLVVALPKRFSSGSVGWYTSARLVVHDVSCQVSMCFTIVGSAPGWVPYKERQVDKTTPPANQPETPQDLFEEKNGVAPKKRAPKRS